jgi:hypothetical protein
VRDFKNPAGRAAKGKIEVSCSVLVDQSETKQWPALFSYDVVPSIVVIPVQAIN